MMDVGTVERRLTKRTVPFNGTDVLIMHHLDSSLLGFTKEVRVSIVRTFRQIVIPLEPLMAHTAMMQ